MKALMERVETQVDTEPHLPAVSGGKPCGVKGCPNAASPWVFCEVCGIALCASCATMQHEGYQNKAFCPDHKGGK